MTSWQTLARSLRFGESRKVTCCGTDRTTYVSNDVAGIRTGPCFRCGYRDFEPHRGVSQTQLLAWRAQDTKAAGRPAPRLVGSAEWPRDVLVWLGKAGISPAVAEGYGAGWADKWQRFVIPCSIDGKDTGAYTARSLTRGRPKYVAGGTGDAAWIGGDGRLVVFVEDALSAWRIRAAGFRAAAAMGKSLRPALLEQALRGTTTAISWFDPDSGGREAYTRLRRQSGLWEQPLRVVTSLRDPKNHTREEIINYIGEATC